MSKYRLELQTMFSNKKKQQIEIFLEATNYIDLTFIKDNKNNTVLHRCAFQSDLSMMKMYIAWMKNKLPRDKYPNDIMLQEKIKSWVNDINDGGYTAIHYAAFKGNIAILIYLRQQGADILARTKQGLNIFHLAAQSDHVKIFIFLKNDLSINIQDQKLSTSLHWAAYISSEKVTDYLLAQKQILLNQKDKQGQTPLHLATAYGNTKIVKKLLLQGAQRNILNHNNQKPIDIARENSFNSITSMLKNSYSFLDYIKFYCNIKMRYQPQSKSILMPFIFILSYVTLSLTSILSIKYKDQYLFIYYIECIIQGLVLLNYITLLFGTTKIKPRQYIDFIDMKNLSGVCFKCIEVMRKRSFHCFICKQCIEQYDHHCPWINNCVGRFNLKRFIFFICFLQLILIWLILKGIFIILFLLDNKILEEIIQKKQQQQYIKKQILYIIISIIILIPLIFLIPIGTLISVQLKNICRNETTYQRFNKNKNKIISSNQNEISSIVYQKKQYSFSNCCKICYSEQQEFQNCSLKTSIL